MASHSYTAPKPPALPDAVHVRLHRLLLPYRRTAHDTDTRTHRHGTIVLPAGGQRPIIVVDFYYI